MSNLITEGTYNVMDSNNKKEYEDSKGEPESVNQRTESTMAKRKRTNNYPSSNMNPTRNRE
jgi:hypothetical protein